MSGEGMPFFVAGWCFGSLIIFGVTRDWLWLLPFASVFAALVLYVLFVVALALMSGPIDDD